MEQMQTCPWDEARRRAASFSRTLDLIEASIDEAVGGVLAQPLRARADIPAYDIATADGWAIAGPGPWRIRPPRGRDMFAGLEYHEASDHRLLRDGQAAPVTLGEPLGKGVTGVVSGERARVEGPLLKLIETRRSAANYLVPGSGIRPRGSDASVGTMLIEAGERVTPAITALAALAAHDTLPIIPMPTIGLIRIGEEVLDTGVPRSGLTRDAVSPALPGWIAGLHGRCQPPRWVTAGDAELIDHIDDLLCDVVVTAGPGSGGVVRRVMQGMKADLVVDGVECQPGKEMLLAHLQDGRPLVHCGDVPADAMAALLTLLVPILCALTELPDPAIRLRLDEPIAGDRKGSYLLPVKSLENRRGAVGRVSPGGPGGLFALARATGIAVIPPGGVRSSESVVVLPMP